MSSTAPKSSQPKTTCEYCGKTLSAHALQRHVGTSKCMEEYWRRQLDGKYARPKGTLPLDKPGEDVVFRIFRKAGMPPDRAPLRRQVVWEQDPRYPEYKPQPVLETLVPTWLGIGIQPLVLRSKWGSGSAWWSTRAPRTQATDRAQIRECEILEQDVITLLGYLDTRPDEALALGAELELVAGEAAPYGGRFYELSRVWEVMRRWASEVISRATLPE